METFLGSIMIEIKLGLTVSTLEFTFIDSDVYAVLKDFFKFQMKIYSVLHSSI